ncbi:MAG TPA: enoyl-CoA hydratase-related protein [Tepidiformaceae bacterium]|nr:enoyl-CoA hydratase-related protein [Tepidiformaceae bacterium]
MAYKDIVYEVADGIARLTLNKPNRLNALSWGSWAEIEDAIESANADDAARVVIITGEGRGFSAGTDLVGQGEEADWHPRPYQGREAQYRSRYLGTATVYNCIKPTIAAVNGVAVGAGFSLALACDIRIASEAARFSAIFVKRAIVADTGCTWFLPRIVGQERALEMMYTGRMVGAEEAARIGLVSEAVSQDRFAERVTELAGEIAHGPSLAVELNKRLAREAWRRTLEEQIELEEYLQAITHRSDDAKEGRASFLEKRDPVFRGR